MANSSKYCAICGRYLRGDQADFKRCSHCKAYICSDAHEREICQECKLGSQESGS